MNTPTPIHTPRRIALSTWSLHRALGKPAFYGPDDDRIPTQTHGHGALRLLDVPARIAQAGFHTLELCHFHLPSTDASYLSELRAAADKAQVEIWNVLIDAGDVVAPVHGARDEAWIVKWIGIAHALGAKRVRVIAGKQAPTAANLKHSREALLRMADQAEAGGMRVLTENWFELSGTPDALHELMHTTSGRVGLLFDFGNWKSATKHADLTQIARYAESCHCKPQFNADGSLERADYTRCFDIVREASFSGPFSLIYDGPNDDEFAGLAAEKAIATAYLN